MKHLQYKCSHSLDHFGIADDDPRVNPYGGAIAVGHPLASSGVRLMLNLARTFEENHQKFVMELPRCVLV